MKLSWKIAIPLVCAAVVVAAVIGWHLHKARVNARRLAADAVEYRQRAEQGDAKAQFKLGQMYYYGKGLPQNYAEALRWYRKAADQGDAEAQYAVGYIYANGQGVPQSYAEALAWWRKAADQGDARGQDGLAGAYYYGAGVPQDYVEAARWYRKAADKGDAWGQYSLGSMCYRGNGVRQDYAEAARWYRKAAEQGYARAQYDLGYLYSHGKGVPQDYAEAARWYRKASQQGDNYAQRTLDGMNRHPGIFSKITLSICFLGSVLLLLGSRGRIRDPQQRTPILAGLLGLLWLGVDLYGYHHIGFLESLSALNGFYFAKHILAGTGVAMFLFVIWPQGAKTILRMSAVLLIGFNLFALARPDLWRFELATRIFSLTNGLFIGMSIPSSIILWRTNRKPGAKGTPTSDPGVSGA